MSTATAAPKGAPNSLTAGQLPRYTAVALLALSLAVTAGVLALFGRASIALVVVLGAIVFLGVMMILSTAVEGGRKATDRLARYMVTGAFLLALVPLVSVIWTALSQGLDRFDLQFFTYSMRNVTGEGGGAMHAVWGSVIVTGWAAIISVPIGLLTAIYLVEYGKGRFLAQAIRFFVDVMTGIPSIVAGLFAFTVFSLIFGPGTKIGVSGAVALSLLMIPTVVRSTEEMLRLVPNELREASYALGVPKWRTIMKIVLPTSVAGIITGVVLAVARIMGETAPLLVAVKYTDELRYNVFSGEMATLPVFVYRQFMFPTPPVDPYYARAWTGALVLILIVMLLNLIGRIIAWKFAPKPGR